MMLIYSLECIKDRIENILKLMRVIEIKTYIFNSNVTLMNKKTCIMHARTKIKPINMIIK